MELAIEICTRVAEGKPLTAVCKQAGMPRLTTVYAWRARYAELDQMLRRARGDMADTLFAQTIEIADEKCIDSTAVQRNRLRVDARKWAAAKLNARLYGDQLAIGGTDELPPLRVDPLLGAKSIAFVLARAGHLLDRQGPAPEVPTRAAPRVAIEQLPPYRQIMSTAEPIDLDADEADAEMSRIGDPQRQTPQPQTVSRQPLSARGGHRST